MADPDCWPAKATSQLKWPGRLEGVVMNEISEKLRQSPERHETELLLPSPEQAEPLRAGEADPSKAIKEAREAIAETTRSDRQLKPLEALKKSEKASEPRTPLMVNRELKATTLRRQQKQIRRELSLPGRGLSKVIHQPAVRMVSEAAGQSVARPSGLLGGGIAAFAGTLGYLYLAKHLGFNYNYLIFLALMVIGFAFGVAVELLVHLFGAKHRHQA
jgi:hypothetical protein